MEISEKKMQIVIDNYFKLECDVNTSIRNAYEKGFRTGVKKGIAVIPKLVHGHWEYKGEGIYCSNCGAESGYNPWGASAFSKHCPECGAKMDEVTE